MIKLEVLPDEPAHNVVRCASCGVSSKVAELAWVRAFSMVGAGRSSMLLCEDCLKELNEKLTELLHG